jgi:hypothetical protein
LAHWADWQIGRLADWARLGRFGQDWADWADWANWANFRPLSGCLLRVHRFLIKEVVQIFVLHFSTIEVVCSNFDNKMGLATFGRFFTNASGRPGFPIKLIKTKQPLGLIAATPSEFAISSNERKTG